MPRPARWLPLLSAGLVGLAGCGGDPPAPKKLIQYDYGYGPVDAGVFKDAAPANRTVTPADLPTAFVDAAGNPVDLAKYRGKNVVLVVTRGVPQSPGGVPCQYCVAQTAALAANLPGFADRTAEVLVVFPGPSKLLDTFARSAVGKPELPFPLLLDKDLAACDKLGIRADLAKPSTFILDKTGRVVYAYVGESLIDRPSVKALYAALDRANGFTPPGSPGTSRSPGTPPRPPLPPTRPTPGR